MVAEAGAGGQADLLLREGLQGRMRGARRASAVSPDPAVTPRAKSSLLAGVEGRPGESFAVA